MYNGYKFDDNGEMVKINVRIVWGPPASGKTTYVKNNMSHGDMVIDLDFIKQSISFCGKTETPDALLDVAIKIRELLYKIVEKREINCDVWVVAGLPNAQERTAIQKKLSAELIQICATEQECIDRACKDVERTNKCRQIAIIRKWFRQYYGDD